jgi:hypothetical protein
MSGERRTIVGLTVEGYEILDLLGAGGMGEVYRARDTRLRRLVAIKIVRNLDRSGHDTAESLIREAQHASRLNHPNICTVHHIGEFDGQPFIVIAWPDRLLGKDARLEQRKGWSGWHVDAFNLASLHARVGHTDEALRWLRTAYDARSTARCGC